MAADARGKMILGAASLVARGGVQAASFGNVLDLTGAPRGSIYHHFPGGKDELILAAIDLGAQRALALFAPDEYPPAAAVAGQFFGLWREVLTRSEFQSGCAVLGAVVTTDSAPIVARAGEAFRAWRADLADRLEHAGVTAADASRVATLMVAAAEGAVVLARAERSLEPFDAVAAEVTERVIASVASDTTDQG